MTDLPTIAQFTGATVTEAQFKTSLSDLRSFLSEQMGSTGTKASVLAAFGALLSKVVVRTSAYTVALTDRGAIIDASGTWTLTLPTIASAGSGFAVAVDNRGTGTITVDGAGSETIEAATTLPLAPGECALLVVTSGTWMAVMFQSPVQSSATDATAGRLLRLGGTFGSFGLGGTRTTVLANLDSVDNESGLWFVNNTVTTGTFPPGFTIGWLIQGHSSATTTRFPMQIMAARDGGALYWRGAPVSGAYGPWNTIAKIERGTWTPVLADAQSGGNVASTSSAVGQYWRIGDAGVDRPGICTISGTFSNINTTGMTAANAFWIRGLPFPSSNVTTYRAIGSVSSDFISYSGALAARLLGNASSFQVFASASGVARIALPVSSITSGTADLNFSITYGT